MRTTAHLNLLWTVGDMDRLTFMRANRARLTFEDVSEKLHGTGLAASPDRLREIAAAFDVTMLERRKVPA